MPSNQRLKTAIAAEDSNGSALNPLEDSRDDDTQYWIVVERES